MRKPKSKAGHRKACLPAVFVVAVALTAPLAGCRRSNPDGAAIRRPKVALVMKSLANEFFKTMEAGARKHHAEDPSAYELISNGIKDEQDVGKQFDLVEQMVARGVDAIVLAPADSRALIAAAVRAMKAGVVVINIDNRLDPAILKRKGVHIPFVGPSNRKGAELAGLHLAKTIGRGGKVAIIEGLPTADNAQLRRKGFEDAVAAGGLEVVAVQAGNWEMAKANQITSALLTEHPDLQGLMCANDSMALGAAAALKSAGREDAVRVVGFDNISAVKELVRDKRVLATVEQHGHRLAVFGIEYALQILAQRRGVADGSGNTGAHSGPPDRETPVELVTYETLTEGANP